MKIVFILNSSRGLGLSCFLVDNLESLVYRLRKDLAAFLGLELPSLPPPSVEEEEKKERRKNLASYLGVEENVLSTVLPPPPPPSTLRHRPGKAHLPFRDLHPHAPSKVTPPECHLNYSPPPKPANPPDHHHRHHHNHSSPKWEVDSAFSTSSTTSSSSLASSSYSTIYL